MNAEEIARLVSDSLQILGAHPQVTAEDRTRVCANLVAITQHLLSQVRTQASSNESSSAASMSHTATSRMRQLFAANPHRVFGLPDLYRALPGVGAQTIRATVGKLCRDGDGVQAVDRGRYRALQPGGAPRSSQSGSTPTHPRRQR